MENKNKFCKCGNPNCLINKRVEEGEEYKNIYYDFRTDSYGKPLKKKEINYI